MDIKQLEAKYPIGSVVQLREPAHSKCVSSTHNKVYSASLIESRDYLIEGYVSEDGSHIIDKQFYGALNTATDISLLKGRLGLLVWHEIGRFVILRSHIQKIVSKA